MRLWLDPVRMAGRGVSPSDVSAAIAANNFQAAAGQSRATSSSRTFRPIPICETSTIQED